MPEKNNVVCETLRVARRQGDCRVLGPGKRAVVWFHGCSRNCPGCIAFEMNRSRSYSVESPESLCEWVLSCEDIEGLTLSGGEPMEQDEEALMHFLSLLRTSGRNLGVICFTGYRLAELRSSPRAAILPFLDVLVDGPYVDELNDGMGLRGSSNQGIHFLTSRYCGQEDCFRSASARNVELALHSEDKLVINGIPGRGFVSEFAGKLAERGYRISFE